MQSWAADDYSASETSRHARSSMCSCHLTIRERARITKNVIGCARWQRQHQTSHLTPIGGERPHLPRCEWSPCGEVTTKRLLADLCTGECRHAAATNLGDHSPTAHRRSLRRNYPRVPEGRRSRSPHTAFPSLLAARDCVLRSSWSDTRLAEPRHRRSSSPTSLTRRHPVVDAEPDAVTNNAAVRALRPM